MTAQAFRPTASRNALIARGGTAALATVVALASYRYLFDLPPVPPNIATNLFRSKWLVIHATFASTALLIGPLQFLRRLRARAPGTHRRIGQVYILSCLAGAVSGIVLAAGTTEGPIAGLGFGLLGLVWLAANILGWQRAVQAQFTRHREWMIRSWALTLSAVTLRLYIPAAGMAGLPDSESYRVIAFLCWVPNLVAAELYLRIGRHRAREASASEPTPDTGQQRINVAVTGGG